MSLPVLAVGALHPGVVGDLGVPVEGVDGSRSATGALAGARCTRGQGARLLPRCLT